MKNGNSNDFLLAITFPSSIHIDPDVCRLLPWGQEERVQAEHTLPGSWLSVRAVQAGEELTAAAPFQKRGA